MPYLGKQSEQVGVSIQKYEFLQATDTSSGTTSFSVPSDSGDHVNVWLNGVLLVEGGSDDYSKSNTAITFNSAPADGDIIRIDVVESFALPDALKSSGDTMTGALKLNGGIKQQTSADLSGTYADHQVMLSDSYSVTGNVTISDNLVLAKLSDDSNAVTLTNDTSTRTVTGEGSLEMGTLIQTPNASLTGMTGEIGSTVDLSSATFPKGSCIQVVQDTTITEVSTTDSSNFVTTGLSVSITPKQANSNFRIDFNIASYVGSGGRSFYNIHSSKKSGNGLLVGSSHGTGTAGDGQQQATIHWLDDPTYSLGEIITYTLYVKAFNSVNVQLLNSTNETGVGLVTEIAG